MARYKYDLQYEIRLNSNAWIDISALADSRKLSIQRNSCTTEFKSAIDSASFTLQPKPALYDLRAEVVNILMEATDNANHAYVRISKRNTMPDEDPVIFLGVVDASSISITTLRIPQAITIQCQDISIVNLDNAPSQYIVLENKKTSEIVKTLIEHAGFIVGSVDIKAEDDVYHRAFVAYSDKDDTYRDYIDTLLFEAGGYALDCGKNGLMNIIRIRIGENTEGARLVDNYLDAEGINSSTSILDSDGIKLKWSTIAETHPDSPQTVYVDDINREIDDETGILKGDEITPGGYWPEDGNVDKTYFEYEAEFLDREYQSGQKKNANEDLSLILVKNTSASINVWTEDGVQLNPEDVFDYPIPAEFEEETNPAYYPDKAWWLLHNKSGQNLNLTSFSIQGDCIYRDRINTLLMPSTSAKPEEYESVYIYTAEQAQKFARFYHDIKKYARTQHAWSELGIVEVGSLVKIAHKTTDIGQVAYVVQVTYSYIGDRIKSDCIAISIGPYNEYNFRQWGQNNGANDSSAAISSITDYYLASSEYQGVTVNTPGWSTDADYGADDSKPYLWKYTKTQYVNGKVENSKPVIIAVKGDAKTIKSIDTEYALADSSVTPPAEDSDAWQDTLPAKTDQSQSIWKRTVITYSDGTIEYTDVIVLSGLIVFQYAYGKSAVNPPTPSIWIWGKKFMVWGNLFISSEGSAIWSATRPEKPEGQWYLWMRISTDGGQTWNDPVCISGNDAVGYELSYSPATYQMTDREIVKTRGQYIDFFLDISNIPYNANDIVWNVEANGETPLVKGTDWDILDNDPTQIRVTFPFNFKSTSFTVSVVITGYEDMAKTRTVGATIIENSTAEYLDVVTELPEDGDNVTSRGPLKDGDYILLETINENDKQERIPYRWTVVEGIGKWVPVGGDNRPSNYAEIMAGSLADALKSDITQNSVNAFYGFIRDLVSQNATVDNLFSLIIEVFNVIFGGGYDKDGNKRNGDQPGFHLSAITGILKAFGAEIYGRLINPSLTTEMPKPEISSASVKSEYQAEWDDLSSMNYQNDIIYMQDIMTVSSYIDYMPGIKDKGLISIEPGFGGNFDNVAYFIGITGDSLGFQFLIYDKTDNSIVGDLDNYIKTSQATVYTCKVCNNKLFVLGQYNNGYPFYTVYYRNGNSVEFSQLINIQDSYTENNIFTDVEFLNGTYFFLCVDANINDGGCKTYYTKDLNSTENASLSAAITTAPRKDGYYPSLFKYNSNLYVFYCASSRTLTPTQVYKSTDGIWFDKVANLKDVSPNIRNSFIDNGVLYYGAEKIFDFTADKAVGSDVNLPGLVFWAKKLDGASFVCMIDTDENKAVLYASKDNNTWSNLKSLTTYYELNEIFPLDEGRIYNVCKKYGQYLIAYGDHIGVFDSDDFALIKEYEFRYGSAGSTAPFIIDNGEEKGISIGCSYGGLTPACMVSIISDFLSSINNKLENTEDRRNQEPLSVLQPCSGTAIIGNSSYSIEAIEISNNRITIQLEDGSIKNYQTDAYADIEIKNLVIASDGGIVNIGTMLPFYNNSISIGSYTNRLFAIFVNLLNAQSLYLGDVPKDYNSVGIGYAYIDENGFLKIKQ